MVKAVGLNEAAALERWARRLAASLELAGEALDAGEAAEAERRAKAIAALVKAARDIADLRAAAHLTPAEDDEETIRAEIRARIAEWMDAPEGGPVPAHAEPAPAQADPA